MPEICVRTGVAPSDVGEKCIETTMSMQKEHRGSYWQESDVTTVIRREEFKNCKDLEPVKRTRKLMLLKRPHRKVKEFYKQSTNQSGRSPSGRIWTTARTRKPTWGGKRVKAGPLEGSPLARTYCWLLGLDGMALAANSNNVTGRWYSRWRTRAIIHVWLER